jgi:hypothetical protein
MYSRSMNRYVHFGLGAAREVGRVEVRLTDGETYTFENPSINSTIYLNR